MFKRTILLTTAMAAFPMVAQAGAMGGGFHMPSMGGPMGGMNVYAPVNVNTNINRAANISVNRAISVYSPVTVNKTITNNVSINNSSFIDRTSNIDVSKDINVRTTNTFNYADGSSSGSDHWQGGQWGSHSGSGGDTFFGGVNGLR